MEFAASHIILNGQLFSFAEIAEQAARKLVDQDIPEWEKELYLFLNEWFSATDYIRVQTSGSTGEPKSIEMPKMLMIRSAERTISYFGLQKGSRMLLSLPCLYIAGKMMVVRAIVGQMNLVTVDPAGNFDLLQNECVDLGAMVPNQLIKLLEHNFGKDKLQNIRNLLVGGSAISKATEEQISKLTNRVVSTYGMTETASHIAIRELSGNRKTEFYHCLPGISVSLGKNGCLQILHPEFDEPLLTNDLAEVQSETSFRILGRADSVIISGGIKYSPETLEKKLEPIINERFVISSVPDEKLGEKLALVIEGKPGETTILKQKIDALLTPFERPKVIYFLKHFPTTVSGKIMRKDLKQLMKNS